MDSNSSLDDRFEDTWGGSDILGDVEDATLTSPLGSPARSSASAHGKCLYLGPAGQRCNRDALDDEFCSVHQPGATAATIGALPKRTLAAIIAIAGILWPYISDLIRELVRWIHSH
jgi:hypothetical protein